MNTILSEAILSLNDKGYFEKYSKLSLLDIPGEKELSRGSIPIPKVNELLVFGAAEFSDIPIGTSFDVIFPYHEISDYINSKSILKYVTVNPRYEVDYLPRGYSGICLLEFTDGKPDILKKIALYREKKDYSIHDTLILTQKPIFDLILKELNIKG